MRRPARLTRLTAPSAVAAVAAAIPWPIANATMWTFISGNAHAPKKRVAPSHQKGADLTAPATVQPPRASPDALRAAAAPSGSRWSALSGTTTSSSSAAQTSSVVRQPSAVTSACARGMKQKAPKPVPRSTMAIARPRAWGYQSAATVMFVWLPSAASPRPARSPYVRTSSGSEVARLAATSAAAARTPLHWKSRRGPARSNAQPMSGPVNPLTRNRADCTVATSPREPPNSSISGR